MNNLPLHFVAIFCLLACYLGIRWGYGKRDRQLAKERKAFFKQQEARLPRAMRK